MDVKLDLSREESDAIHAQRAKIQEGNNKYSLNRGGRGHRVKRRGGGGDYGGGGGSVVRGSGFRYGQGGNNRN